VDGSLALEVADLAAWMRLAPLLTDYLPYPQRELRPAGLAAALDEVLLGARTVLLQCGAGSSSVLLARLLARRGFGRLLAIEDDERQAAYVGSQLRREGLLHIARIVQAPLAPHPAAVGGLNWYAPQQVYDEVSDYVEQHGLIDMLLVGGPPSEELGAGLVRYPALPVLRGALAPGATLLLDDIDRAGELTILTRWQEEFDLRFRTNASTRLATAVFTPGWE
jgi:hypothetical protein